MEIRLAGTRYRFARKAHFANDAGAVQIRLRSSLKVSR
jgi:hypothetical protein